MITARTAAMIVMLGGFGAGGCSSCREEPPIVVRFQAQDLGADLMTMRTPLRDAAAAVDLGGPDLQSERRSALPRMPDGRLAECRSPADCTVEPAGCCGCNEGGGQRAVSLRAAPRLRGQRMMRCRTTLCTMMMSNDPSCARRPDCVQGRCVLGGGG